MSRKPDTVYFPVRQQCPKNFYNRQTYCDKDSQYCRGICCRTGRGAERDTKNGNFKARIGKLLELCEQQIQWLDDAGLGSDTDREGYVCRSTREKCPINVDSTQVFCKECIHKATCCRVKIAAYGQPKRVKNIMNEALVNVQTDWQTVEGSK